MASTAVLSTRVRPRLLAGLVAGLASRLSAPRKAAAAEAPDIIVMVLNDAREGDQIALPQTMARLRDGGTTFPNFFLSTPLCCPSRATMLTGLYGHNNGVYENSDGSHGGWFGFAKRGNRGRTTGAILQEVGYRTVAIGTYLNGEQPGRGIEYGWDAGPRDNDKKKRHKRRHKKHHKKQHGGKGRVTSEKKSMGHRSSDGERAEAAAFEIANAPLEQPLYLHIGFGTPHVPLDPVPPYEGQFEGAAVDRDLAFNEEDISDKPRYIRKLGQFNSGDEAWLDGIHQKRLECLLELDDQIVQIWDALEARGRLNNTYVFLVTDNGYLLGQHRHYGKRVPYDGSARMSFYAYGPGFQPGAVDGRLVGNVDLAPTLVEVSGASAPEMDGVSLLSAHERDAMLLEFLAPNVNTMKWRGPRTVIERYRALRTASHLYVEYTSGERELYDYAADPYETENLLAGTPSPEVETLSASLHDRLIEQRSCRGATCL